MLLEPLIRRFMAGAPEFEQAMIENKKPRSDITIPDIEGLPEPLTSTTGWE